MDGVGGDDVLGCVGGREPEVGERERRVRERGRGFGASSGRCKEGPGKQEVARAASALATHLVALLAEGGRRQGEPLVGWARTGAGPALLQVRSPGESFSLPPLLIVLFSYFCYYVLI